MMQLAYVNIDKIINLDGITKHVLVIKNPHEFYKIVNLLNEQSSCAVDDGFVLSDSATQLELKMHSHCDILIDYFNMQFNDKKIQNLINSRAVEIVNNSELKIEYDKSAQAFNDLIDKIISQLEIRTTSEAEISIMDILKIGNLKVLEWYKNPLEMIVNYINILTELKNIDILFLVNVKQILNEKEVIELYEHCSYIKLNLVLIETEASSPKIANEEIIYIDNDLCEVDY